MIRNHISFGQGESSSSPVPLRYLGACMSLTPFSVTTFSTL